MSLDTRPTVLAPRDLVGESFAGVVQRPRRTALTMLGTILGVGGLVATLGLTATAGGQISEQFSVLGATQAVVTDAHAAAATTATFDFPPDAERVVGALHGVRASGVSWRVPGDPTVASRPYTRDAVVGLPVLAASPGLLTAADARLTAGAWITAFERGHRLPVLVLGDAAAAQLGITTLAFEPSVFVDDRAYTVVGIIGASERMPELRLSVVIPDTTAIDRFGPPVAPEVARMLVATRLGAAAQVAREAPVVLRPDRPDWLAGSSVPNPEHLQQGVARTFGSLFGLLALLGLLAATLGIATTTLVAVIERVPEIGLRRALGATRCHVAVQFLAESTTIGAVGGLLGAGLGVLCVVVVSLVRDWTVVLAPWAVYPAPLVGAVVGLVAGAYPALRAARIEPADALRR